MKNLPLNTYAFRELELDYREWLALLGYAENTVYNMPLYMHEFFHWLENDDVKHVKEISAQHVDDFLFHLKQRPNVLRQIRASVIAEWTRRYDVRIVQYMSGHKLC